MDFSFRFLSIYLQTKQRMYGNVLSLTNIQICYCIKTQFKNSFNPIAKIKSASFLFNL